MFAGVIQNRAFFMETQLAPLLTDRAKALEALATAQASLPGALG